MDGEGRSWDPTWEPLESFDLRGEHPDDTLDTYLQGGVTALNDKLPVCPSGSRDPTHGRQVLTKVWHRQEGMDELQQVDLRGTVFVNPNKGDTASLPYVVRYDKAEESDEEMDLQGLGVDLFFEETPAEVPAPHVRMSESQSDLSAAAGVLTIHTDEVHPDRDIVGTGGWALVWGRGQSGVEVYGVNKPDGR